jgi:hypothetical protein
MKIRAGWRSGRKARTMKPSKNRSGWITAGERKNKQLNDPEWLARKRVGTKKVNLRSVITNTWRHPFVNRRGILGLTQF